MIVFQVLLDLASLIFEEQQSLEVLLRKTVATILSFMQAQECTVFIADRETAVRPKYCIAFISKKLNVSKNRCDHKTSMCCISLEGVTDLKYPFRMFETPKIHEEMS